MFGQMFRPGGCPRENRRKCKESLKGLLFKNFHGKFPEKKEEPKVEEKVEEKVEKKVEEKVEEIVEEKVEEIPEDQPLIIEEDYFPIKEERRQ